MKLAVWRTLCGGLIAGLIAGAGFADGITSGVRIGTDGIFNTVAAAAPTCATSLTACDAATQTIVAASSPAFSASRRNNINTLVLALKSSGWWSVCDAIYAPIAAETIQGPSAASNANANINWINPGTFTLLPVNAMMYTPSRGYQGDANSARVRTQFTPSTQATQMTQNNASAWAWVTTQFAQANTVIGSVTGPRIELEVQSTGNTMIASLNDANASTVANTVSKGFYGVSRASSTAIKYWKNGAQLGTDQTVTSTGLASQEQWLNGGNSSAFNLNEIAFTAFCAENTGQEAALYSAVNAFVSATLDTTSWQTGQPFLAYTGRSQVSTGLHLAFEFTQPWSAVCSTRIFYVPASAGMCFTNVTTTPAFPGYELWFDGGTFSGQTAGNSYAHVRIINNITTPTFIGVYATNLPANDGLWHTWGASYDGSGTAAGIILYRDGVQLTTAVESNTLAGNTIIGTGQMFFVGNQANHQDFWLQGQMGHFSLSNIVRSGAYFAAHATAATQETVDANHVLFYNFSEGCCTLTTADQSSNNFSGTVLDTGMWRP